MKEANGNLTLLTYFTKTIQFLCLEVSVNITYLPIVDIIYRNKKKMKKILRKPITFSFRKI